MSTSYISEQLKSNVRDRSAGLCEYCRIPEYTSTVTFQFDHIISEKVGGITDLSNLAYSCPDCNRFKGPNISSYAGSPPENTPLYNPRSAQWDDHFYYREDGTLMAKSVTGEGTIHVLGINRAERVKDRSFMFLYGIMKVK